jgi:glycosyltransferase involved in cell wall biosynthesis
VKVSVCVAATRPDTVGATVRSIAQQSYRDWELVVIAQGPGAQGVAGAVNHELGRHTGQVISQAGRGLSRARNAAIAAATGDLIAMIDDDCEADPEWLDVMVERLQAEPQVGLIGGAVVAPPKTARGPGNCPTCSPEEILYQPSGSRIAPPTGFVWIGANFAFLRSTADAVGDFDRYLGAGARFPVAEEIDFRRRAERLGIAMLTTPKAIVRHTYGWRYGTRAVWNLQRNYARGNGAYAAKLTMLGDPKGRRDLQEMRLFTAEDWLRRRKPVALPAGIRRYLHFASGYRECLRHFRVDDEGLLQAKVPVNE